MVITATLEIKVWTTEEQEKEVKMPGSRVDGPSGLSMPQLLIFLALSTFVNFLITHTQTLQDSWDILIMIWKFAVSISPFKTNN